MLGWRIVRYHSHVDLNSTPLESMHTSKIQGCLHCRTGNLNLFVAVLIITTYILFGAVTFHSLEAETEKLFTAELAVYIEEFLDANKCISRSQFYNLTHKLIISRDRGIISARQVNQTNNWDIFPSILFAGSIVTTVGNGHVSPVTQYGKAFTIFYGLIGIPITISILFAFVDRLKLPSNAFLNWLNLKLCTKLNLTKIQYLHFVIFALGIIVFIFIVPALFFTKLEPRWNYLDSLFYCFICMTTIGIGNYVPGSNIAKASDTYLFGWYHIANAFYIIIGLCFMMLLVAVLYDIPSVCLNFESSVDNKRRDQGDGDKPIEEPRSAATSTSSEATALNSERVPNYTTIENPFNGD